VIRLTVKIVKESPSLSNAYKILSTILLFRLTVYVSDITGDYQCGFHHNKSTIDQIFYICQILEKIWEYKVRVHQLLDYADNILLGDNTNTIKQTTEFLLEATRNGLGINAEKTVYMIMSHHQNSGQNQNKRTANESFENVAKFKYLGMTQIRLTFMMKSRVD
jgi:hypothetical protein